MISNKPSIVNSYIENHDTSVLLLKEKIMACIGKTKNDISHVYYVYHRGKLRSLWRIIGIRMKLNAWFLAVHQPSYYMLVPLCIYPIWHKLVTLDTGSVNNGFLFYIV